MTIEQVKLDNELNVLLINHFGYMGSAFATLAAYGSMMFLSLYLGAKYKYLNCQNLTF
jgi:O-antigen/teichoic acid export membrane protein